MNMNLNHPPTPEVKPITASGNSTALKVPSVPKVLIMPATIPKAKDPQGADITITTTASGDDSESNDGVCKTMEDVRAYNEREKNEEVAKHAALLPPIEDSTEFLGRPIEKPPVLIEGLLKQKRIMVLGASSKVGKTWTLINLAISIASGQEWLGLNTTKGKVLYLNFELADDEMQERIEAVKVARCVTLEKGQLDVWNLSEHSAPYNVILPAIYERIKAKEYAAIVLDPIYCMYGDLDENSAGDVSKLMNALRKLANKSKAAIVFAHHFSKGNQSGKESQDRISGSGVWGRAVDTNVSITAHELENAYTLEATPRGFKKIEPFVIKWEYPLMVRDDGLNPGKLKTAVSRGAVFTTKDLLKHIAEKTLTTKELKEVALGTIGMSQTVFYELLKELEKTPGVTYEHRDKKWSYAKASETSEAQSS